MAKDIDTKTGRLHLRANRSGSDLRERLLNAGVDVFIDTEVDSWAALSPKNVAEAAQASQRSLYDTLWPKEAGGIHAYRQELYDRCWGEVLELSRQHNFSAFPADLRMHIAAEARKLTQCASDSGHSVYFAAYLASAAFRRAEAGELKDSQSRRLLVEHFTAGLEAYYRQAGRSQVQAPMVASFIVELLGLVVLIRYMFDVKQRIMSDDEVEKAVLEAIDRQHFGTSDPMDSVPIGPMVRRFAPV